MKESMVCFNKAIRFEPRNVYALTAKASTLESMGKLEESQNCYNQAFEIDQNFFLDKAIFLTILEEYNKSLPYFDKSLELDPRKELALHYKAITLNKLGRTALNRHKEAIKCFDNALEIDPTYVDSLSNKGFSLIHLGKVKEALLIFNRILAVAPKEGHAWYGKAKLVLQYNETEALDLLEKTLSLNEELKIAAKQDQVFNILHSSKRFRVLTN
jgi:tetratricopeptide (TPR) repeat protein